MFLFLPFASLGVLCGEFPGSRNKNSLQDAETQSAQKFLFFSLFPETEKSEKQPTLRGLVPSYTTRNRWKKISLLVCGYLSEAWSNFRIF